VNEFRADGKVALITGAGPNNGHAIAERLAQVGADVAVSDLTEENSQVGADRVAQTGRRSCAVPFDITDLEAVRAGVARVEAELGPISILVNNAGTIEPRDGKSGGQMGQFVDSDPAIWHRWIDLNVYGSLNCIHSVLRGMVGRSWGRVVQISSGAGSRGLPSGHSTYGAGKAAIEAAVRHIAIENGRAGVTLNSVAVGPLNIKGAGAASNPDIDRIRASVPVGRVGEPEDIASAVQWLASDAAGWITAQTIHVNGGVFQGR
jgi:NAD(P)-dependent dehydrogenase (short-subunit alcohol dehydrogenase family)